MSKNKVIKKRKDPIADPSGGRWVSGPIDWPDVAVIQRALETWSKGAKLDFEVTEDLFYKLLSCKGADDDEFFDFGDNGIRWRDQLARNHVQRQQRATASAAAHLDFPTTLSAAARWYCFAQVYTECSLPGFAAQVLEAHSYEDAVVLLQDANRAAKALVEESSKKLLNTPQKPANGYFIAQKARDEARQSQLVIASCLDALRLAESNRIKFAYLAEIQRRGLAATQIDYPTVLRLTTVGTRTLGDLGSYALRMDGPRVVGIGPGLGSPAFHSDFHDGDLLAMADHQSDAGLDLPTSAMKLVNWVFGQSGSVELAIPDVGRPDSPEEWCSALAALCKPAAVEGTQQSVLAGNAVDTIAHTAAKDIRLVCTPRAKALQVLIAEAVRAIGTAEGWPSSNEVISWLLGHKKDRARTHETKGNQYYEGRRWCRLIPDSVQPQLNKLKALNPSV